MKLYETFHKGWTSIPLRYNIQRTSSQPRRITSSHICSYFLTFFLKTSTSLPHVTGMVMSSRSITPARPRLGANSMNTLGLEVETYQRTLTYGQIKGMKALLKLMKRLHPKTKLVDMAVNQTNFGSPGSADTYRVRMRYRE